MNYDDWKTEYYELQKEITCQSCHDQKYKLDEVIHFMEEVVKQLYTKNKSINEDILDHCISEICHYLNIKLGVEALQIVRKNQILPYLSDWIQENNKFLNTLIK